MPSLRDNLCSPARFVLLARYPGRRQLLESSWKRPWVGGSCSSINGTVRGHWKGTLSPQTAASEAYHNYVPSTNARYVEVMAKNSRSDRTTSAATVWRMPAEYSPHQATWIAWPHRKDDWPGKFAPIPWVYGEIVRQLLQSEDVNILVNDKHMEAAARRVLSAVGLNPVGHVSSVPVLTGHVRNVPHDVRFFRFPTDRAWTRDYGPIFVTSQDGKLAITDWRFNAWAKYPDWHKDDAIPAKIARALRLKAWQPAIGNRRVVLEGGSIDVNGQGLLLTTEECLLSPVQARNPGLSKADVEQVLCDSLGVPKVLWLGRGIAGDDTHGHIDDLARFVGARTVVTAVESDP